MNELNEKTTIRLPVSIAWGFCLSIAAAAFWLGLGFFEFRQMAKKLDKVDDHDKRLIRIETKLGLSQYERSTNSVMVMSTRGDL